MHFLQCCSSLFMPTKRSFLPGLPSTHKHIYDAIFSKIPTMKISFQVWKQTGPKGLNLENTRWEWGWEGKSRTPWVNFPILFSLSPDAASLVLLYTNEICTISHAFFLKIIHHDNALTFPKDRDHHLSCWRNSFKFLKEGVSQNASIVFLAYWPQDQSDWPKSHLKSDI